MVSCQKKLVAVGHTVGRDVACYVSTKGKVNIPEDVKPCPLSEVKGPTPCEGRITRALSRVSVKDNRLGMWIG